MQKEYIFSGTLGDAYIALCKLNSLSEKQPCYLRRMCRFDGFDDKISEIVSLFNNIYYNKNFLQFETNEDQKIFAFNEAPDRFVNIFFDGNGRGNEPDDPPELYFTPFPDLRLKKEVLFPGQKCVGIQMHCGSRPNNQRVVDINWIEELSFCLKKTNLAIVLLGTGYSYSRDELDQIDNLPANVINMISKYNTIEWLNTIANLDYFISPEGLATFFSLSQRVQTCVVFEDVSAILRMHGKWRDLAVCVKPDKLQVGNGSERWLPLPIKYMEAIILTKLDPEALLK